MINQGNAQAAGIVGAGNQIGGGLTTAALLSKLTGGGGMYATPADAGKGGIGTGGFNAIDNAMPW